MVRLQLKLVSLLTIWTFLTSSWKAESKILERESCLLSLISMPSISYVLGTWLLNEPSVFSFQWSRFLLQNRWLHLWLLLPDLTQQTLLVTFFQLNLFLQDFVKGRPFSGKLYHYDCITSIILNRNIKELIWGGDRSYQHKTGVIFNLERQKNKHIMVMESMT